MKLVITLDTYIKIQSEVEKEVSILGYNYFNKTLDGLYKCIDKKRDYKHSISEIKIGNKTIYKIILFIDEEKYLLKLTSKMKNILFPKEKHKIYKEPKETCSLFM